MRRTVTVLQDDIDNGVEGDPFACAVALAARRELADLLPERGYFSVVGGDLKAYGGLGEASGSVRRFRLPEPATRFYQDFDHGRPVEPFKFELEVTE